MAKKNCPFYSREVQFNIERGMGGGGAVFLPKLTGRKSQEYDHIRELNAFQ